MTEPLAKLTRDQAAIVGAYTGVLCGPFSDLHEYIEKVMGRPVLTHEMGDKQTMEQIKEAAKADFLDLCADQVGRLPEKVEA